MRVFVLGALALAMVTGCGGGGDSAPQTFEVTYGATGSGGGDVTYAAPGGSTAQEHVANGVAFHRTFTMKAGDFIYVSVQNNSPDALALALATIAVDGRAYRAGQSTGPFVIATASATCCQ